MIKLNRSAVLLDRPGTTPNVAKMHGKVLEQAPNAINLGQGSEIDSLSERLREQWDAAGTNDYNDTYHELANAALADFFVRFLGLPATKENSVFLQQPGRYLFLVALMAIADKYRDIKGFTPKIMLGSKRWSVIDKCVRAVGMGMVPYDSLNPDRPQAIENAFREHDKHNNPEEIVVVADCSPDNPLGRHLTDAERLDTRKILIARNSDIVGLHDDPYVPACVQNEEGVYPILNNGYDSISTPLDNANPEIVLMSCAKAFQKAQRGEGGVFISDDKLMQTFKTYASSTGGLSFNPKEVEKRVIGFGKDFEDETRKHFAQIARKYRKNWENTGKHFTVVKPSGPNMTVLIEVTKDVLGKQVEYVDGSQHTISDGDDFVQFLANREEPVTVVFDALTDDEDLSIRLANKNLEDEHNEALERIHTGIIQAIQSPLAGKVPKSPSDHDPEDDYGHPKSVTAIQGTEKQDYSI